MMNLMRKLTRHILWIVIAAFVGTIVFAWGMRFSAGKRKVGVVATINGQDIQWQNFMQMYEQNLAMAREQYDDIDENLAERIRDNTWENMVYQVLLNQEIKKRNIEISGKELYEFLKRFPPAELRQAEIFQTEGKFDSLKYLQALADPRIPWGQIEAMIRPQLEVTKLQEQIIGLVRITDEEVKRNYISDNEKVQVKYIQVLPDEFKPQDIQVTEDEIENYYQSHQEEFQLEERAQLAYVKFEKKPSSDDDIKAKTELVEIKELVNEGEDFGDLALEYSQDLGSAENFGDLGWFGKGEMVKTFEDVAFSLDEGEISEPVKTKYGWHLIKVIEKKKEKEETKVHASHILIKVVPSEETIEILRAKAESFLDGARELGFEKQAEEDSLEVSSTNLFDRNSLIPQFARISDQALDFAFENEVEEISEVYESENDFFVLKLVNKQPSKISPLVEVKARIKNILTNQKKSDLAHLEAEKIYNEMKSEQSFEKTALKFGKETSQTEMFSRNDYLAEVKNSPEFKGAAFALTQKGQISPPVKSDNGTYILKFVSREEIIEEDFSAVKDSLTNQLLMQKQNQVFSQWYTHLKENAKIEDFRERQYQQQAPY